MLRRGWKTEPAIAVTRQQDVVTRVVGPPGIVLIGEGNVNRLRPLLTSERRKHERVASDTPISDTAGSSMPKSPSRARGASRKTSPTAAAPARPMRAAARTAAAARSALPAPRFCPAIAAAAPISPTAVQVTSENSCV